MSITHTENVILVGGCKRKVDVKMGRPKTGRKSSNEYNYPRKNYIVTLSKDREFIIVRFCCKDYGLLNINLLKNKYVKPYLNEGWEILDIEVYYNKDWADY